mmetsp:Transcript_4411/g.9821  ORF Transcript_4411/g.9821 Transcript_4411/m.9821 type:complete len:211 (+) Transcript_4411:263-895(+)
MRDVDLLHAGVLVAAADRGLAGPAVVVAVGGVEGEVGAAELRDGGDVLRVLALGPVALGAPAAAVEGLRGGGPAVAAAVGAEEDAVGAGEGGRLAPGIIGAELALGGIRARLRASLTGLGSILGGHIMHENAVSAHLRSIPDVVLLVESVVRKLGGIDRNQHIALRNNQNLALEEGRTASIGDDKCRSQKGHGDDDRSSRKSLPHVRDCH